MPDKKDKLFGLLAEFKNPQVLFTACEKVRDAGFKRWDAHTPFPVHGLEHAMGLRASPLPWIVFIAAMTGLTAAITLQWWIHSVAYPLVISGKPFFSWQAFVPVTFEVTILCSAAAAVLGMFGLNKLPRHHHSLFRSKRFERATDDAFFISIETDDPKFDADDTEEFLKEIGAINVERVQD